MRVLLPASHVTLTSFDLRMYFYPVYEAFYGRLAGGTLPLWNPWQLCGVPWLGTLQGGFLYPPHALYLVLPTHLALGLSALLHLALIAFTTALFALRAGLTPPAATLVAVLFTLLGRVQEWLLWPYHLEAIAWLPLGCFAVLGLVRREGRCTLGLLALAAALSLLAGSPQATAFAVYAWAALLITDLIGTRATVRGWVAALGGFALAIVLGAAVAAVPLASAAEMTTVGVRAGGELDLLRMFPFGDPGLWILHPVLVGGTKSFSVLAVALLPAALLARGRRGLQVWALGVGFLALLFSIGPRSGVFWLYRALPGLSWFREPQRILVLTHFAAAVLAGIALAPLLAATSPKRAALARGLSAAAALIMAGVLAWRGQPALALVAVVVVGTLLLLPLRAPGLLAPSLLLLVVAEFALPPRPEPLPYGGTFTAASHVQRDLYAALAGAQGSERVWVLPSIGHLDAIPKLATWYGVRAIDDYEQLPLRRQAEYFTFVLEGTTIFPPPRMFVGSIEPAWTPGASSGLARRRRLLDLAALRLIAVDRSKVGYPELQAFFAAAGFEPRGALGPRFMLFENPHVLPRAFVVYRTRAAPTAEELLARISAPDFDPLVESYVEGDVSLGRPDAPPRGTVATIRRDDEHVVEIEASLVAPGLVVLADSFSPGWHATVDGMRAPILATNHLFRGVPVPAGTHRVRFDYRPRSVVVGLAVSLVGVLGLGTLFLVGARRRQTSGPSERQLAG
jgi:hypothetical protein